MLELAANYNSGTAGAPVSSQDTWTIGSSLVAGPNGASTLTVAHPSGSTGAAYVSVPLNAAKPTLTDGTDTTSGFGWVSAGSPALFSSANMYFYNGTTQVGRFSLYSPRFGIWPAASGGWCDIGPTAPTATQSAPLVSLGYGNNGSWATTGAGPFVGVNIGANLSDGANYSSQINWTASAGAGNLYALLVAPTINQSGTASGSYTCLRIAAKETSLKGSANKLIDCYVGSAGTTPVFSVDNTGNIATAGKITNYGGIATVGSGNAPIYAAIDLTAQTAAKAAGTALYSVPATGAGLYRVSCYAKITTASDISSTLGGTAGFQLTWTDPTDSTTPTAVTFTDQSSQSLTGNTTTTVYVTSAIVACKASTNLQYGFGYTDSHTSTAMAYKISVKVEYLG